MAVTIPDRASVVVIGGGVIGVSIAFHLAEAGFKDVLLLEQNELASGSTSKAAGGVRASFSNAANIQMGLRGLDVYARFPELYGQQIDFESNGYLYLLSDEANLDVFTEGVALQNAYGIPSRVIDPAEARDLSPLISTDGLLGAVWSPHDGKATPESVVMGYASAARRFGARLIQHCPVTDVRTYCGRITAVGTPHGAIAAERVVCAAGAWSGLIGDMVGVNIPVTPVRRQIAFTEEINDLPRFMPSLTIDFPSTFYFHREGKGLALGWSDPDEPPGFNLSFELERWLEQVGIIAEGRAPSVANYGIKAGWAGLYEVTPDQNQIIDRCRDLDGLVIATGFSGHGFLMGPATGEIVRDLMLDREPSIDISPFRLTRFSLTVRERGETNIV